jgi:hypothetical protein
MSDTDGVLLGTLRQPYEATLTAVFKVITSAHSIRLLLTHSPTSGKDAHADLFLLLHHWSDVRRNFGLAREAYEKVSSELALAGGPVDFDPIHAISAHEAALEYQRLVFVALEGVIDMPSASQWAGCAEKAWKAHQQLPPPDDRLLGQLRDAHDRFASVQLPDAKAIIAAMRVEAAKASAQTFRRDNTAPPAVVPAGSPAVYLLSWREILGVVDLKNNEENRRRVRELTERYQGPIILPARGGQPKVNKAKLLEWWNGLEIRWKTGGEGRNAEATTQDQYAYGKSGEVVPEISGHVKKKRRTKDG